MYCHIQCLIAVFNKLTIKHSFYACSIIVQPGVNSMPHFMLITVPKYASIFIYSFCLFIFDEKKAFVQSQHSTVMSGPEFQRQKEECRVLMLCGFTGVFLKVQRFR